MKFSIRHFALFSICVFSPMLAMADTKQELLNVDSDVQLLLSIKAATIRLTRRMLCKGVVIVV
jgi:hypothetical protein